MADIEFEEILPFVEGEGDTGKTAREKINRNFTKIEPLANVGAEMQQLRQNVSDDLEQLHDDVEEMVDKTTSLFGYYNCSTAGATAAKTVQATGYELTTGGNIRIKMEHANTASSPVTLQIGNATAKQLYYNDEPVSDENTWEDNETIVVYYDGASYCATNSLGGGGSKGDDDLSQFFNVVEEQVGGSANLIDPNKYENGIVVADGSISGGNYMTTDYIEVEEGETYTFYVNAGSEARPTKPNAVCYYGASKEVVSYISTNLTNQLTVPTGGQYVRISRTTNNGLNPALTGLIKGANLTISDFVEYEPLQTVEHLELNDNDKNIEDKSNNELVTKKNLVDYVDEQMEEVPDISGLQTIVNSIKQKTDMLGIGTEQVGGSTNLLNPEGYEYGFYDAQGVYNSSSTYCTAGYIDIENGKTYTFLGTKDDNITITTRNVRFVYLFNSNKEFIQSITLDSPQFTIDNANAAFIRITPTANYLSRSCTELTGLFEGENPEWEAYSPAQIRTFLTYNQQATLTEKGETEIMVKGDLPPNGGGGDDDSSHNGFLTLSRTTSLEDNSSIDIIRVSEDENYIDSTFDRFKGRPADGPNVFNFVKSKYMSVTSIDNDDVPAIHMKGNILGANHSVTCIRIYRASHGLTNRDIGGVMTDELGQNFVILRIKDADNIYIMSLTASNVYGSYKWNNKDAQSADKTGQATYNNQTTTWTYMDRPSVYPSTLEQTQKIIADGVDVTESQVSINADVVDIIDNYNIVDFNQARNILMNRYGEDGEPIYESPLDVRLESVYRFMKGLKVIVTQSIIFANDTNFLNFAFADAAVKNGLQSSATTAASLYKSKLYVPGSKQFEFVNQSTTESLICNYSSPSNFVKISKDEDIRDAGTITVGTSGTGTGSYDFTTGVTSGTNNYWHEGTNLLRMIQVNEDNVGFVLGFLPVGICANPTFLLSNPNPLEVRGNTMKLYPHPLQLEGSVAERIIPAGSCYTAVAYRIFFDAANQSTGRICLYDVDYDGYKYVFVDYSQTIFDHVELDDSLNGHSIELVEQRNAVLKSSVYNSGFYVNATHVSGDSSYCVVKIKL